MDGMDGEEEGRQRRSGRRQPQTSVARPGQQGADRGVEGHVDHVVAPRVQTAGHKVPPANRKSQRCFIDVSQAI